MLLGGIALGLIAGLAARGRVSNLASVQLRWAAVIFIAVIVRFGTEIALDQGLPFAESLRVPLFALAFAMLAAGLWQNRQYPGLALAMIGVIVNGATIVWNGGRMPVWEPSLVAAGLGPADVNPAVQILLPGDTPVAEFLLRLGPFSDIIPIAIPVLRNVASIGDLFLSAGLAFFLFATLAWRPEEDGAPRPGPLAGLAGTARLRREEDREQVPPETGLAPGLAEASALQRPLVLASAGPGLAEPALAPLPQLAEGPTIPVPAPEILERARRNPYVRLALNASFSALWTGQLISLFGDRVHQIALAFLVYQSTGSAIATGLVFVTATLPNLVIGPIAGTLVDRWDQKQVMIVADLLRAACVLIIPVAAVAALVLVYPLIFLVTAISIFFRPARTAVIPRIVDEDDLLVANSATWLGETAADLIGYPLAAAFVALLGASLPLAFWFDAATYIASALLIASVAIPPLVRTLPVGRGVSGVMADLRAGWTFMRHQTVLLANTLQGTAGQFTLGILLTVTPIYATQVLSGGDTEAGKTAYGLLEMGIGVGNLIGGALVAWIAMRLSKGRMVILGYVVQGVTVLGLAFVGNLPAAFGLLLGSGIANMIYIIPSQTFFQELAPPDMIGRVVGFRFALVFGSLTLAAGLAGVAVEAIGIQPVLAFGGLLTIAAGMAGWFVPAVRNA